MKCDKCMTDLNDVCECEYKQTDMFILCNDCYDEDYFVCEECELEFEKDDESEYQSHICKFCCEYESADREYWDDVNRKIEKEKEWD